jgi:2'-5' RNA ligase
MRLFYAAFLGLESIDAYDALVAELVARASGALRSVPRGTQHLTLGFLGEVADTEVRACTAALDAVERLRAIPFVLEPPGILFARRTPRLIKADVSKGSRPIVELQRLLLAELARGVPRLDIRPKPPHVTLARFKKTANHEAARTVERLLSRPGPASSRRHDRLDRVRLVRSRLTPDGPIYETVAEAWLSPE